MEKKMDEKDERADKGRQTKRMGMDEGQEKGWSE